MTGVKVEADIIASIAACPIWRAVIDTDSDNMRQVQPKTLPKNSNFSYCLQNIKLKNNTT
jgi:hypothetical protein